MVLKFQDCNEINTLILLLNANYVNKFVDLECAEYYLPIQDV